MPMAAITEPLLVAGIVFSLGMAATSLLPNAGCDAGEMGAKMVFRVPLGPVYLAVLILVLGGVADHLYLIRSLQP
jgi:hypothetical protein